MLGVLGFWIVGALLGIGVHACVHPMSAIGCDIAKLVAILAVSFVYMRFIAREATVDHGLFAGAMWLALSIVAELATSAHDGRGWFVLIGSPDSVLRNVLMFAWIFTPSLFARHRKAAGE